MPRGKAPELYSPPGPVAIGMRFIVLALVALLLGQQAPLSSFAGAAARPFGADDLELSLLLPMDTVDIEGSMAKLQLDLGRPADRAQLRRRLELALALGERQNAFEDDHPERRRPFEHDFSSAGKRRALRELIAALDAPAEQLRVLELVHALDNGLRYPLERDHQIVPEIVPSLLLQMHRHAEIPVAGDSAASPPPSSFWTPRDVHGADLLAGFWEHPAPPKNAVCEYLAPKTGWGAHPGFDVSCADNELRFNLGDERYGAPFNTRIFHALGYNVRPVDAVHSLSVRYDRRMLTEYNMRKLLDMRVRFLFFTIYKKVITDIEDPFARIDHAVLKDGSSISGVELRRRLIHDAPVVKGEPRPEAVAANYDPAVERQLDYLVWESGTLGDESEDVRYVGAWDYDQLDHADRREVRALLVLAAWVDQFNLRWENTRVGYRKVEDGWELLHYMSDVGSGLGSARDLRHSFNSDVEAMPWVVTERRGDEVRFTGFAPSMPNRAFDRMGSADARWMLRRIAGLSERQILSALLATDMSAAEARLALEKLLSKRRKMLQDFGILGEFPEIAARTIDTELSFDPAKPADLARVTLLIGGEKVHPEGRGQRIVAGHLVR